MTKLHADSIVKSYGDRRILTDIYVSCGIGEIVGLLGRNGSGKSTLLKIIFGSLSADYRYVKVGDNYIKGIYDGSDLIKYLPSDDFLPSHIKVRKIIDLFCNARNASLIAIHPVIRPHLDKKCRELSGGERRFLEILLIIYSDARYILLDEPFNGISPIYIEEIKILIKEQSSGKGVIMTDHSYRNILAVATRTVLLHEGAIREIKNAEDLKYWSYIP